jgi:hypothetical protein
MAGLQSRLDESKKAFESGAPPYNAQHEAIEKMHRATVELKASGIEEQALRVGDRAPSFALFNQDHMQVSSLLQYGAGGSTGNPFRSASNESADRRDHS